MDYHASMDYLVLRWPEFYHSGWNVNPGAFYVADLGGELDKWYFGMPP